MNEACALLVTGKYLKGWLEMHTCRYSEQNSSLLSLQIDRKKVKFVTAIGRASIKTFLADQGVLSLDLAESSTLDHCYKLMFRACPGLPLFLYAPQLIASEQTTEFGY